MKQGREIVLECVVAATVFLLGAVTLPNLVRHKTEGSHYSPEDSEKPLFDMEAAEKLTVEQLADRISNYGQLILPTWMPGRIELTEIYLEGSAILTYSDHAVRDYREDNVTIQVVPTAYRSTPDAALRRAQDNPLLEVVELGDLKVILCEDAAPDPYMIAHGYKPIVAWFDHNYLSYIVTGIKGQVATNDVREIIRNMQPIGTATLRKA